MVILILLASYQSALSQEKVIRAKFSLESEDYIYFYGQQKIDSNDIEYSPVLVYKITEKTREIQTSVEFEGSTRRMVIEIGGRKLPKEFHDAGIVFYNGGFQVLLSEQDWISLLEYENESDFQKSIQHFLRLQILDSRIGNG